jgi:hypothetical protein
MNKENSLNALLLDRFFSLGDNDNVMLNCNEVMKPNIISDIDIISFVSNFSLFSLFYLARLLMVQ